MKLNIKDPESDVTKDLGRHGYSKPHYSGHGTRDPYWSEQMLFATRQPPIQSQQQHKRTDVVYYSYGRIYCNQPRHNSSTCRHQSAVQCNKCGVKGHKSKHHTSWEAGQEESAASEPLEYDITETVDMSDELDLDVYTSISDSSVMINDISEPIVTDFNDNDANVDTFPHLKDCRNDNPKNFIFTHLNINWFHTKFHEVHEILSKDTVDLYAISETKLNPTITSEQVKYFQKDY